MEELIHMDSDFNVCLSEEQISAEEDDSEVDVDDEVGYKTLMDLTEDEINGMEFACESDAYNFYFSYGKCHGFVIRKDEVRYDDDGNVVMCQFLCCRAGLRDKKHLMRDDRKKFHRPLSRTDCKAKLRVRADCKRNLITINDNNLHWFLLVIDINKQQLILLDSYRNSDSGGLRKRLMRQ
ncbi:hypothetical protein Fmac_008055 [Flemingia macrophylla]|uniref:FAR1 domain-containing protein n=1 Tax=Flemingia macrophylla TaxID=520843 RepID=A0ABD1MYQ6_9FABA